jgi:hypothetical protein
VTLSGKLRTLANVPGGMWLEDMREGTVLTVANHQRVGIRAMAPGAKEERELGWFGWSELAGISRDGKKILFEEEGDGGGPNYTVFLRDTDGSPPAKIGEGRALALSGDAKFAITEPAPGGQLMLVPTGAGESKQLTHDSVSYSDASFLLDGKHVLASGIEAGHGGRDYLIDLSNGDSKPITPEGTAGTELSPDGASIAVQGPDGKLGVWPLDGSGFRLIPEIDPIYVVVGWTPDSQSVYVVKRGRGTVRSVTRVNIQTGKMEPWKTIGEGAGAGVSSSARLHLSADGSAYAYIYSSAMSEAYVVTGLK